jgi:Tol biopolymer transport system component
MESDVCLISEDGEGRRVVVRGVDDAPIAISPDGKSIVYAGNRRLWTISSDGRRRRQLTQEIASYPSFSPDGDRLAFMTGDSQQPEGSRLMVTDLAGDKILSIQLVQRESGVLRWTIDGKSILLPSFHLHTVWIYPLRGQPKQLTNFDDMVWSFDVGRDGKSLLVAQGSLARDAVLITGFR